MQEPRRWRRLQLRLLPVAALALFGCAGAAEGSPPPAAAERASSAPEAASAAPGAADSRPTAPPSESTTSPPVAATEPARASASALAAVPGTSAPAPAELPTGTKVLQIGDSFADALGKELGKRLKAAGVRTSLEFRTPSYVPTWAFGPDLPKLLASYNPDLVLITLGANELEIPDPAGRAGAVQRLVQRLGERPCVWILPPLWKPDTGLMQVIKDNAAPCRVLDSSVLVKDLPRGPDHIHPNAQGRETWAEAVFQWLKAARLPFGPKPWSLAEPS